MAQRTTRVRVSEPEESYEDDIQDTVEDRPVRANKRVSGGPVSSGWGAPKEERRETVKAPYLDLKNGKLVIKILDTEPSVNFKQHYVNSQNKYATCSEEKEYDNDLRRMVVTTRCPLCDAGHKPSQQFRMNVVDMDEPDTVKTWTFGWMVAGILQGLSDEKDLNEPNRYFHVWRTKPANGGTWTYTILPLKSRDLQEDHSLEPLTEDELDSFELYGAETVWISSQKQLEELADRLTPKDLSGKN